MVRALLAALALAMCGGPAVAADPTGSDGLLRLELRRTIDHGARAVSAPSVLVDDGGTVHLAWIQEEAGGARNLYYLPLDRGAAPEATPAQVNPADMPVAGLHLAPALALGRGGELFVSWSASHPKADGQPFASLLKLSRSTDRGRSFDPPVPVNDDPVVTGHSFDHLAVAPDGTVHLAWIDGREGKKEPATFVARSADSGRHVAKNLKVDDETCVCCRTAVATGPDGTVYVAWRKVFAGDIRETVVARSTDGGRTFSEAVIVGHDRWAFPACPHRPASLGVDREGRLYVVWYTEGADETPAVYLAWSDDRGKTFSPKRALNTSKGTFPDHPQMAVNQDGLVVVAWEEQSPVRREVVVSYSRDRGKTFSRPQRVSEGKAHSPAVAVSASGEAVLAWTEQGLLGRKTLVQTARLAGEARMAAAGRGR